MKTADGAGVRGFPAIEALARVATNSLPPTSITLSTVWRTNLQVLPGCTQLQLKNQWKPNREKPRPTHPWLLPPTA